MQIPKIYVQRSQYVRLDKANGGSLYKHLRHQLKHRKRPVGITGKGKIKGRVGIEQRSEKANNRKEFGHWEADLIAGKNHRGFILTLTERVSKELLIAYLPRGKNSEGVSNAMINMLLPYKKWVKSITMDNGLEFAGHSKVADKLKLSSISKCNFYRGYYRYFFGQRKRDIFSPHFVPNR